jgi:hypothetical protein
MTAWEIEHRIYEKEEVRVVIRTPSDTDLAAYSYQRAAPGTMSVSEWLRSRIYGLTDDLEVVVVDGNGAVPHGRTRMSTLRASYER